MPPHWQTPPNEAHEEPNDVECYSSSGPSSSGMDKGKGRAEPQTVKKRKLNRACDSCRRRKGDFVQLPSGDLDKCLNCFSAKTECTFSEEVKVCQVPYMGTSIPHTPSGTYESQEVRRSLPCSNKTRQALLDGTIDPSPVALTRNSIQSEASGEGPPSPEIKVEEDDAPRLIPFNYHQDQTPSLFMGESSDPQLVIRALRLKQIWEKEGRSRTPSATSRHTSRNDRDSFLSERRPMFWNTPSVPLMDSLLSLYFEHYNIFMPLIHRPTLERELREGLHRENEAFATTVLLMCALGSRYSDDPGVLLGEEDMERYLSKLRNSQPMSSEGVAAQDEEIRRAREHWCTSVEHSRGWKYFEQAWDARGSLAVILFPSLYDVQASVLSVAFLRHTSFPHVAWAVLGVGLRLLQDIGGHRRIDDASRTISRTQEELLKRACWVMVSQDRMLSMATGRPCALRSDELDMDLPTECDDEYWEHPDPLKRWKQPSDRPSLISAFIFSIGLLDILDMVLKTIYGTKHVFGLANVDKNTFDKHVVAEVDSALNTWIGRLPPHLVWDANQPHVPFLLQSAVLHAVFHYIQILVHRPFIPTPRRPARLGFPSLLICTNAARAILKVCGAILDRGWTQLSIFSAGTVLLLKGWHTRQTRGSDQQFKKDMDEAQKCMRILRAMENRTFLSGRLWYVACGSFPFAEEELRDAGSVGIS
ncbi:fungal-specific transcription factor domain-containing protein [Coprinopsis sp. MPI-PUGE-AT-0042]|nr:fungal-specific transcription factor domain-containing protein [Coprinopsis sp. MPI-PUGE-AT-0042]